jgi:hypothetical protein
MKQIISMKWVQLVKEVVLDFDLVKFLKSPSSCVSVISPSPTNKRHDWNLKRLTQPNCRSSESYIVLRFLNSKGIKYMAIESSRKSGSNSNLHMYIYVCFYLYSQGFILDIFLWSYENSNRNIYIYVYLYLHTWSSPMTIFCSYVWIIKIVALLIIKSEPPLGYCFFDETNRWVLAFF